MEEFLISAGKIHSNIILTAVLAWVIGVFYGYYSMIKMDTFNTKVDKKRAGYSVRNSVCLIIVRILLWPIYLVMPRRVTGIKTFPFG